MTRRFPSILVLLLAAGVLSACGGVDSDESQPVVTEPDQGLFTATFKPASAQVPFPNDIFFSGTADGTLNIPASASNPGLTAMNDLDGYSTTASIYVDTTDTIASQSLVYGQTVFLINTNTFAVVPATVGRADYSGGNSVIEIVPAAPLAPATTYAGFVTTNVQSTAGDALGTDTAFQGMLDLYAAGATPATVDTGDATTDAVFGALHPLFQLADGATIGAENLAVAWSFKTQSVGASIAAIEGTAGSQTTAFVPVLRDPANPGAGIRTAGELLMPASDLNDDGTPDIGTQADVYIGMIEMPYYTTDPLTGHWVPNATACAAVVDAVDALSEQPASTTGACALPAVQDTFKVPVLLTVPNASSGSGGAIGGVTLFQHGITSDRSSMLALAGAVADAGQALIAIDLPLHGITDDTSPLYAGNLQDTFDGLVEQTFDIDADEDGEIDDSGANFINLTSLLTTRDSLRQAAANLIYLAKSVPDMDYNAALGAVGADFTGLPISFVGMSLGAMTGTTFLANNADANAAVLSVPGGVVAELLINSATFAPVINAGLEENGVIAGTRFYKEFLRNAQTVIDSGDAINYAATANANHPVLMHSIIGGAGNLPDQVIPNSSTDALAAAMGLTQITATTGPVAEADGLVKFTAGGHSSLLDPSSSVAVTTEMQTQVANYVGSGGALILITDGSVIDQ
jgi:hypothetical protein